MHIRFLTALVATVLAIFLGGGHARADIVTIGLQESGVDSGNITTENSGTGSTGVFGLAYGNFTAIGASGSGVTLETPDILDSTGSASGNVNGSTLLIYVTDQNVTSFTQLGGFIGTFTTNKQLAGLTVTETIYVDPDNGLYTTTNPVGQASFVGPLPSGGNEMTFATFAPGAEYSVTEVYTITDNSSSKVTANSNIDLTAVPEPASIALLGAGLMVFGIVRNRRRRIFKHGSTGRF